MGLLDQSDEDYINKQMDKLMEPTYNKVQYSEFTADNGQWVFRAETVKEVKEMIAESGIHSNIVSGNTLKQQPVTTPPNFAPQAPVVPPQPQSLPPLPSTPAKTFPDMTPDQIIAKYGLTDMQALQVRTPCKRCGGQQIYNPKTGKVFCKAMCWTK